MARWLFKEEPTHYNFADLERDGSTIWNGITNNLARKHLRQVRKGDRIFYYHTGKEKAIVGEMVALSPARPDTKSADKNAVMVEVKPVRRLRNPVPLDRIKAEVVLSDWELVRNSRLSVMPVTDAQWQRVMELSFG